MSAKLKTGLGRGLDALMDPYIDLSPAAPGVTEVRVQEIDTNAEQPRKRFDETSLKELAASIAVHGIVQPLIVKQRGERYMIIAGERRFRAARLAGLATVPVLVTDYDEAAIHEVSLIENIQRENLNPVEEAAAIRFLMQQHDMTQEEVAERLGKSRPAIANALRLLQLPEPVIDKLKTGELTAGHGRALAGLGSAALQQQLCDETLQNGYSVRMLEQRVAALAEKKPANKKAAPVRSAELTRLEGSFRERLGTKVKITGSEAVGRVVIDYFSKEDLQSIYDHIMGEL